MIVRPNLITADTDSRIILETSSNPVRLSPDLTMDFIKNAVGGGDKQTETTQQPVNTAEGGQSEQGGGFLSGIGNKLNSAAGGGKESEKNEDYLDKGMHSRKN